MIPDALQYFADCVFYLRWVLVLIGFFVAGVLIYCANENAAAWKPRTPRTLAPKRTLSELGSTTAPTSWPSRAGRRRPVVAEHNAENGTPLMVCSFALGRGMYCGLSDRHDGDHAPGRAPVNGPPHGTIDWAEHCDAWEVYTSRHSGQSALRIAERGGFGLLELCDQLGRAPQTWQPSSNSREAHVDGMKRLAKATLPEVIAVARAIEHDRIYRPGATTDGGDPS